MKLSEKCKEYFDVLEQCSKTKSEIEKKLLDIVKTLDYFAREIDNFEFSEGQINIDYCYCYHDEDEYDIARCTIHIGWLDLDIEEIRAIIRKREEERLKKEKLEAEKIEEQNKKFEEELERSLYERLKKKFEGN